MNITIITPVFPYPLNSGGAQAQYNMIDGLRKIHNITIIYIYKNLKDSKNEIALKKIWPNVNIVSYKLFSQLCSFTYIYNKAIRAFKLAFMKNSHDFIVERALKPYGVFYTKALINFINNTISKNNTDIIQVEFYPCLGLVNFLPKNIKKIFIHHEIRFVRNERLLSSLSTTGKDQDYFRVVKQQEIDDLNKYDRIVTLTQVDLTILKENGVNTDIVCSPAAINTSLFPYAAFENKLLFLGGFSHKPNVEGLGWFIDNVASKMNLNKIEIHIIGGSWPSNVIEKFRKQVKCKLIYHGFVENLYDVAQGSIMVIPILTGSGMRMKILEASAMALPFITTKVGVEGLNYEDGKSCIIADSPKVWIEKLNILLTDAKMRKALANKAQTIYKEQYSLQAAINTREAAYLF